jgi:transposase, IS30 family
VTPAGTIGVAALLCWRRISSNREARSWTTSSHDLQRNFAPLPPPLHRTVTFDNGAEFPHHQQLHTRLHMQTYFCDTHAPWQKGGIENAIGRLRRLLPRKIHPSRLTPSNIDALAKRQNHTTRKYLGYQTPAAIFSSLLHLRCESTPSLRSG